MRQALAEDRARGSVRAALAGAPLLVGDATKHRGTHQQGLVQDQHKGSRQADRVSVETGDARKLPFSDASFDDIGDFMVGQFY